VLFFSGAVALFIISNMTSPSTSDAALKLEIARLTASINNAKSAQHPRSNAHQPPIRSNVYVNPNYKPPSSTFRPAIPKPLSSTVPSRPSPVSAEKKEVVIGGVAFESSGRSLVRKDLPKPAPAPVTKPPSRLPRPRSDYNRNTAGHLINTSRQYKPKSSRPRVIGRPNRNMTLNNNVRPYQARKVAKRQKYLDKPCPRFTTTGAWPPYYIREHYLRHFGCRCFTLSYFSRFLPSWIDMSVSTRPRQGRHLLALPPWYLYQRR